MLINNKGNTKVLYKDNDTINQKSRYLENSKKLAELIKKGQDENNFTKYFLDEAKISTQDHKPNHSECDMRENNSSRITEKRICRCMYYFGKSIDKCNKCPLSQKYNNVSNKFKIIDYEAPMKYVIENCGGIDIIIEDIQSGEKYAVEIKPKNSTETLVRMIAEIYTYTADGTNDYKKAIAFFEGSQQERDYFNEDYIQNKDFNYILEQVTVFRISEKEINNDIINYDIEILNRNI